MPHSNAPDFLRRNASAIILGQRIVDASIPIIYLISLEHFFPRQAVTLDLKALSVILFLLCWIIFKAVGLYRPLRNLNLELLVTRLLAGWGTIVGCLLLLGFLTKTSENVSRLWIGGVWSICVVMTLLGMRLAIWPFLKQIRRDGLNYRTAVIVGHNTVSETLVDKLQQAPELGINLVGFFDDSPCDERQNYSTCRWLGSLDKLPAYIHEQAIDVVYITCSTDREEAVMPLLQELQDTTACVYYVPSILTFHLTHGRPYDLNGMPLVAIWEVPFSDWQSLLKRAFDVVVSATVLMLASPLLLLIAIAIKLSSPGPILFRQQRYGLNGKEITVYKFRSMRVMENGPVIKQAKRNDSRITPIGAFLRKTSLDELPQFINVLQGQMSVVGPRPHAVAHNEMYRKLIEGYMLRHKVKPGITGLAQVEGCRGETETLDKMQRRIDYDLNYIKHWSLGLDFRILLRTCWVVFNDQNAY